MVGCLAMLLLAACSSSGGGSGVTCASICPAVVAAKCSNGPPAEADCESGCSLEQSKCPSQYSALLSCAGSHATFTCDSTGFPGPVGCAPQTSALKACISGTTSGGTCASICPAVVAAKCSGGPPDEASCETGCSQQQTKCPTEFAALTACAGSAPTFACDATGSPFPNGCTTQANALKTCFAK
ncbi:MAG: hypothetical protein ACHREM_08060 [Polyangiales bacterium]